MNGSPRLSFSISTTPCDVVHGHQQLSLFNAHYDERASLPIHVYEHRALASGLWSCCAPASRRVSEVRAHLRRLVRHIRQRWTRTRITFRGDGHYARPEAMEWCEANHIDYVFGLPGSKPLAKKIDEAADAVAAPTLCSNKPVVRGYAETRHKAKSWSRERRAVARIEATPLGLDTRFVVTNVEYGAAEWVYAALYCARGQAENLIKLHKTQLASDRTSCRSAIANQVRFLRCTRRLTAHAHRSRRHPETARSSQRRVLDLVTAVDQDRRPRHRNRKPRPSRSPAARRPTPSAACPEPSPSLDPERRARSPSAPRHPSNAFAKVSVVRR